MSEPEKKSAAVVKKIPTVVIIGRTNVGKSSLFNRLTESQKALTSKIAGTTRDYNLGTVNWRNRTFEAIDTGGVNIDVLKHSIERLLPHKSPKTGAADNSIETGIIKQTKAALAKADLLLLTVDGQAGLMAEDKELALVIKKLKQPVLLVVNKIDNMRLQNASHDFYRLGLGQPLTVSAANGSGVGDLLDIVLKKIKWPKGRAKTAAGEKPIRIALIGKPNVGKSSLVNKILGEARVIVSPIPQTTREPQDTELVYAGKKLTLIDTAGLAKKGKIRPGLDKISGRRSLGTIKSADIIIFVTEADKPLTVQDSHLAGLIKNSGAGIIIACNKWDLIEDKTEKIDSQVRKIYQASFPFLSYAPLIFISALTGRQVDKILDLVLTVDAQRRQTVSKTQLKKLLLRIVKIHYPASAKGGNRPHIYDFYQTKSNPPEFTLAIGQQDSLHFSYLRFVENQLRENFGFAGVPITINVVNLKR